MYGADDKLSPDQIGRIVGFLGYGKISAPVWFIGLEEGLGKMDSAEAYHNLHIRGGFEETMDLHEAHSRLIEDGRRIDIQKKPPATSVWKWMAKIMLARSGHKQWATDKSAINDYIRFQLGRANENGETFMTELSSIPSTALKQKSWMDLLLKRDDNLPNRISARRANLQQLCRANYSSLMICYGSGDFWRPQFANLLGVQWQEILPKTYMSTQSRRFLLLPFFGNGRMSAGVLQQLLDRGFLSR